MYMVRGGRWRKIVRPLCFPGRGLLAKANYSKIRAAETILSQYRSFRARHSTDRWGKPPRRLIPVHRLRGLPTQASAPVLPTYQPAEALAQGMLGIIVEMGIPKGHKVAHGEPP